MKLRLFSATALVIGLFVTSVAIPTASFAASGDFFNGCTQSGVDCGVVKTNTTLQTSVWNLVRTALIALGGIAIIVIIIGGIMYVTSQGDSSSLTAAKNTILYAVIGLIVAFSGAAIITLVNYYFG